MPTTVWVPYAVADDMKRASTSVVSSSSAPTKRRVSTPQEGALIDDSNSSSSPAPQQDSKGFVFKNEDFEHSGVRSGKKRIWKNLKQILSSERSLPWKQDDPTYASLDAPPSFKPAKKYSDLSGNEALYTDPQTKLRYSTCAEFRTVRQLPYDIIQGYLTLRNASLQG